MAGRSTRSMIAIASALLLFATTMCLSNADEFKPLCADLETGHRDCWNPVEVIDKEGCHFFGHVSYFDHAPPMSWSGSCWDGVAMGHGVLFDDWGNRARGRLMDGLKEGTWTVDLRRGGTITENHVKGVFHGPWTFDLPKGRSYAINYRDGRLHGPWEHHHAGHYSEAGSYDTGRRQGTWTFAWANGVEASVPYVDGEIRGKVTVTLDGHPLGGVLHWDGTRYGVLDPVLVGEPLDP